MKNLFYLSIFAVSIIALIGFSIPEAHATDRAISDGSSCVSIGGTWNGVNMCTVSSLTINAGDTLIINSGIFLNNLGTIANSGTISIFNSGTITNHGNIDGIGTITNLGTIINSGTIHNAEAVGPLNKNGYFYNNGYILNSGTITTFNQITNSGTIANVGTITNYRGLTNSGIITNTSAGLINDYFVIDNSGTITNFGTIYSLGVINNNSGATITNYDTIISSDVLTNFGIIKNLSGGTITNSDIFNNISGGTIDNSGIIKNFSHGTIDNSGTITNSDTITNYCGAVYSGSAPIGNPVNDDTICLPSTILTMSANATAVIQGKAINFTYNELNSGTVSLTSPTVTDDSCSPVTSHDNLIGFNVGDTDRNGMLDPTEKWVFHCIQMQNTVGTFTHTATGDGIDSLGNHVTAPAYPSEQTSLAVTVNSRTVSVPSATGSGNVIFSTSTGELTSLTAVSQSSLSPPPPPGSYPFGFFSWVITDLAPGPTTTTVTISYPSSPGTVYEKLIGATWYNIIPTSISGNVVTLTLTDGATGQDADLVANGQITDPGAMLASTSGKVTGGGDIGKDTNFGFETKSNDGTTFKGELEYNDKTSHIIIHSTKMTFLSVDPNMRGATFTGTGILDKHQGTVTFLVSVTDPDKKGTHDSFSIVITDSSGNTLYHNSGIVKGHIEIHKFADKDDKSDSGVNHNTDKK